jgi:hypothetical protein
MNPIASSYSKDISRDTHTAEEESVLRAAEFLNYSDI